MDRHDIIGGARAASSATGRRLEMNFCPTDNIAQPDSERAHVNEGTKRVAKLTRSYTKLSVQDMHSGVSKTRPVGELIGRDAPMIRSQVTPNA
jgi:hypothetical protein